MSFTYFNNTPRYPNNPFIKSSNDFNLASPGNSYGCIATGSWGVCGGG